MNNLRDVFKILFENKETDLPNKSRSELTKEVSEIFEKASKMLTNWSNIFISIEEFRNDLLSDDKQDTTATES